MQKIKDLVALCKCGVHLEYRSRANSYETLKEMIGLTHHEKDFLSSEDLQKCIDTDQYWDLQFYPETPIGFYHKTGSDVDVLLDWALDIMKDSSGDDCKKQSD